MLNDRTEECPFPEEAATGRQFISPCCTSSVKEFLIDGKHWLAGSVAGHGWGKPFLGKVDDINDTGTFVETDGTERPVHYNPGLD